MVFTGLGFGVVYRYSPESFFTHVVQRNTRKEEINAALVCGERCQVERKILCVRSRSPWTIFPAAIKELEEPENTLDYNDH